MHTRESNGHQASTKKRFYAEPHYLRPRVIKTDIPRGLTDFACELNHGSALARTLTMQDVMLSASVLAVVVYQHELFSRPSDQLIEGQTTSPIVSYLLGSAAVSSLIPSSIFTLLGYFLTVSFSYLLVYLLSDPNLYPPSSNVKSVFLLNGRSQFTSQSEAYGGQ